MSIFVYYNDDFYDQGGVGLEEFRNIELAANFIVDRMNHVEDPSLDNYTVINGKTMTLEPQETVTKVKLS